MEPLDSIRDFLEKSPHWDRIRPAFSLVTIYVTSVTALYEYVHWQYGIAPPLASFLRSYLVKQTTLVFVAVAVLAVVLTGSNEAQPRNYIARTVRAVRSIGFGRLVLACFTVVVSLFLLVRMAPAQVSHICIKFLDEPDEKQFDKYAFVYLVYELNKLQRSWYFDVDFDTANPAAFTSEERACEGEPLCVARVLADGKPFIGITTKSLGQASFAQNDALVSVISASDWAAYAPPSVYEFLSHELLVQSLLIHLNAYCGGIPTGTMAASRVSQGDLFQYSPRRNAMKAEVMASHLTRQGEVLLMNCFGMEYLGTSSNLLSLDWLRSDAVKANLKRAFGVDLLASPTSPAPGA